MLLTPHPDSPDHAVHVEAQAERNADGLLLSFTLSGGLSALLIPEAAVPVRTDGLWRRTCLEAFVRAEGAGYCEINLSPSGQWAAYAFAGYREGMAPAAIPAPDVRIEAGAERLVLDARLRIDLPPGEDWHVGLAAVLEGQDGILSYHALAHPPGRPDFHHPDCFALRLPARDGS